MAALSKVTNRHSSAKPPRTHWGLANMGAWQNPNKQQGIAQNGAHLAPVSESRALSCRGCTSPSMSAVTPLLLLAPTVSAGGPKGLPCRVSSCTCRL